MPRAALKRSFTLEREYFDTFIADPKNPVQTTQEIEKARVWVENTTMKALSSARSFAKRNALIDRGFKAVEV